MVGWMRVSGHKPLPPLPSYDEATTAGMEALTGAIAVAGLRDEPPPAFAYPPVLLSLGGVVGVSVVVVRSL